MVLVLQKLLKMLGNYIVFVRDILPEMLENVPLQVWQRLWFQHDGNPLPLMSENTSTMFSPVVGLGGVVQYSGHHILLISHSYGFLIWGEMKCLVYETAIDTPEELVARVAEAAAIIRETPGCFERVRQSFSRRYQLCINVNGRYFQQQL